jgi:hypothetical protein
MLADQNSEGVAHGALTDADQRAQSTRSHTPNRLQRGKSIPHVAPRVAAESPALPTELRARALNTTVPPTRRDSNRPETHFNPPSSLFNPNSIRIFDFRFLFAYCL